MPQTIAITTDAIAEILNALKAVKEDLAVVKKKLETAPPYGSDKWWQWSIQRGLREITEGKYETFESVDEYIKALNERL